MFENIPASGIPACVPLSPCDLACKQYPVTDGGGLTAVVIEVKVSSCKTSSRRGIALVSFQCTLS